MTIRLFGFHSLVFTFFLSLSTAAAVDHLLSAKKNSEICQNALLSLAENPQNANEFILDPIARLTEKVYESHPETRLQLGTPVYRATYRPDYDLNSLMGYFRGERQFEIRSWDFQRLITSKLAQGMSTDVALTSAEFDMYEKIDKSLVQNGFGAWRGDQLYTTSVLRPLDQKAGNAIPFAVDDPAGAVLYVGRQLRYFPPSDPATRNPVILYKVKEQVARGIKIGNEYHILSYVPAGDVEGAFIGYWDGEKINQWYFISVEARNPDGSAKTLTVYDAETAGKSLQPTHKLATINRSQSSSTEDLPAKLRSALSRF